VNAKAPCHRLVGSVVAVILLGGQFACGIRSTMLSEPEDQSQTPVGTGGGQAGGAGGRVYGTGGAAGGSSNPASACVGSCSSSSTQTGSKTTLTTSTAIYTTIATQTATVSATSLLTSTGSDTSTVTPGTFTVAPGGFVTSGTWQGYAWTATESPSVGSTITPATFSTLSAGERLCVKGTVAPSPMWAGVGILGMNVNQSQSGYGLEDTWTPDSDGIAYDVTNSAGSPLRIQIQGLAGWPSQAWCALVTGTSGKISWGRFNSACWDGSGSTYDGTPLQNVMILVPGSNVYPVPFSFCLNSLGPS